MNDVLDRYLAQIEQNLPAAKRGDIIEEISDELQSQFEEREAALGRRLTPDEAAEIVRRYGPPRSVAGRYAKRQYLIGPELLPYYWYALKILIPISLVAVLFRSILRAVAFDDAHQFWSAMASGWQSPVWVTGIVTLLFVAFQYKGKRLPARWDPRRLPPVERRSSVSLSTMVFELLSNVALVAAVLLAVSRWSVLHTSVWEPIWVAIIAGSTVNAIALGFACIDASRAWTRLVGHLAANSANIGGLAVALRAIGPEQSFLRTVFAVFLAGMIVGAGVTLWKLYRYAAQSVRLQGS